MADRRILHLGLGSFHRAHQAVYLEALRASGDARWQIVAGNIRPGMEEIVAALRAGDGGYALETAASSGERRYAVIRSIREALPGTPGLESLIEAGAAASTGIISFTVTEAGYYLAGDGRPDAAAPDIAADLAALARGAPVSTIYGALARILERRRAAGAGPVTLLCCDNLRHNGARSRSGFLGFLELAGLTDLRAWVEAETTSPNCMVDRITPRPTPEVRARILAATGRDDAAALMAEDFIQWVIEDRFAAGRPAWEQVGVEMVASVDAHEEAKIRILNASHSAIAWAGTLKGYSCIHEGAADPAVAAIAARYVTEDVIPCLAPSPIDLGSYRDRVLNRFRNAAIADTNQRVAADGFAKIPGFIAPTIRERLAAGGSIEASAMLPALFLAFLERWHAGRLPWRYEDQAMDPAVARAVVTAADPVAALVGEVGLWGECAGDPRLEAAIRAARERLPV